MATQFKMPQLGETVVEGTITRWLKQEGESVEADEPLVEVSTDKVDSEIPAPGAGVLVKIHAQEGDTVAVGDVIAEIGESAGAEQESQEEEPSAEPKEEQPAAKQEKKQEEEPAPEEKEKPAEKPPEKEQPAAKDEGKVEQPPSKAPSGGQRVAAAGGGAGGASPEAQELESTDEEPRRGILSPLVRKLAAEHGVDLREVKGSGTGGRITKQDVLTTLESAPERPAAEAKTDKAAEARPAKESAEPVQAGPREELVQVSNMRRSIADHMVASLHETARAWNTIEVDMTNIARLREKAGGAFKKNEGFSLTWMPFLSKAVTQTLLKYPNVNSTWNGDGTITVKRYVNLGIAVALENGLIVPVVKGADGMNISGLARGIRDVADRARNKKLVPDDVAGGTFTITNPGPFGSILSVPIINKGQAAILAFDAVVKRPVVVTDENGEDSIAIRHMVFLSMSWDHRVIDGAEAALFLQHLKALLEEADFESDLSAYFPEG